MKTRIVIIFLFINSFTYSQQCIHRDLSSGLDFHVNIKHITVPNQLDSCEVSVSVIKKNTTKILQQINYTSSWMFDDVFVNCKNVRSYTTHHNETAEVVDNDFGDLIVADFNFDGINDFALKANSGGNGGPVYLYYLQKKGGQFIVDKFLSETMEFFPVEINAKDKTLMTSVHANAYQHCETTYKLNMKTGMWKKVERRFVGMN